jgi:hypothetical protein
MSRLAATTLVVLAVACARGPSSPATPLDLNLTIPLGQAVAVAGTSLAVRFDVVREDSRCPLNAMCVWAGQAVVGVTVRSARRDTPVELRSDPVAARTVVVDDLRLEWIQLEPYPVAGEPVPPDYRLVVHIVR